MELFLFRNGSFFRCIRKQIAIANAWTSLVAESNLDNRPQCKASAAIGSIMSTSGLSGKSHGEKSTASGGKKYQAVNINSVYSGKSLVGQKASGKNFLVFLSSWNAKFLFFSCAQTWRIAVSR